MQFSNDNVLDLSVTRPCLAFAYSDFYLENKTMRLIIKPAIFVNVALPDMNLIYISSILTTFLSRFSNILLITSMPYSKSSIILFTLNNFCRLTWRIFVACARTFSANSH